MNPANLLTIMRFIAVPFFIYFMYYPGDYHKAYALVLFVAAAITDWLDGYVARRYNMTTEFGKFLDPLADKALVLGAFFMLTISMYQMEIWMFVLIAGRDLMITGLRMLAKRKNISIRTTNLAKAKTAFQMTALITILLLMAVSTVKDIAAVERYYGAARDGGHTMMMIALEFFAGSAEVQGNTGIIVYLYSFMPWILNMAATLVTAISGLDYLIKNRNLFLRYKL